MTAPGEDQMTATGFFTRGVIYELPHPPVDVRLILIVHRAVERAIELLRSEPPDGLNLATARENEITFHLQWVLENRLRRNKEVRGFNPQTFGRVEREPKVTSFDGRNLDKMPDLLFRLKRDSLPILSTEDGLFAECKPVDTTHFAGRDYCDAGLRRFVDGEYAWTMQDALMLAYVRNGRTVSDNLSPAMQERQARFGTLSGPEPHPQSHPTERSEALHISRHGRSFCWPEDRGPACVIRIFHSWHDCN